MEAKVINQVVDVLVKRMDEFVRNEFSPAFQQLALVDEVKSRVDKLLGDEFTRMEQSGVFTEAELTAIHDEMMKSLEKYYVAARDSVLTRIRGGWRFSWEGK